MLTERVRASYQPAEIQHHLDYVKQSSSGVYPTRRLLRHFYTEVSRIHYAEVAGEPFFFDDLRQVYRSALLGHAAIVNDLSIEDLERIDLASAMHIDDIEGAAIGERSMKAAMAPFEYATDYARATFADGQLEAWHQDVVGQAMWYVDAVHSNGCIDTQPDNLHDVSCLGCERCPRKVIASKLLLPIRESKEGALGDPEHRRTKRITDALLKTAILNGLTSFAKEEEYVQWLFDEGGTAA